MSDLAARFESVKLLLLTLNDPYPTPHGALVTDPGPAASAYVPCETCRRTGEVRARGGWMLCLGCDGRGWRRRELRDRPWDAYVGLPLDEAVQLPTDAPARPSEPTGDAGFAWEKALQVYDRAGSYRAVRAQLDWLSLAHPNRHRLVRSVLVDRFEREVSRQIQREVDLGVLMITMRIPRVRVPRWLGEKPRQKETVEALASAGLRPSEIARRLGMSKRAVQRQLRAGRRSKISPEPASPSGVLEAMC